MNTQSSKRPLREIGRGTFGVIFSCNKLEVYKRTILPDDPQRWLEQDALWHKKIAQTFQTLTNIDLPNVPVFHAFMHHVHPDCAQEAFSFGQDGKLEEHYRANPAQLLCTQQIPAIDDHTRVSILRYFGKLDYASQQQVMFREENCLLRIYFGKQEVERLRGPKGLPILQNYPLGQTRLSQALSKPEYLRALKMLAAAVAVLHFEVKCDARDIEFVFGGPDPNRHKKGRSEILFKFFSQGTETDLSPNSQMWLLDFNQVTSITLDETGMEKAVLGFVENDPYYPKPGQNQCDWEVFKAEYMRVAGDLLVSEEPALRRLLALFINKVERRQGLNEYQHLFGSGADVESPSSWLNWLWSLFRAK